MNKQPIDKEKEKQAAEAAASKQSPLNVRNNSLSKINDELQRENARLRLKNKENETLKIAGAAPKVEAPTPSPHFIKGVVKVEYKTVRDDFAIQMLAALVNASRMSGTLPNPELMAEMAVKYTEALLVELSKDNVWANKERIE